jgi:putative FmdB family regulatory protein
MMTYEYTCQVCDHEFDVIKTVAEMEREERCPECESYSKRAFVPRRIFLSGTKVQHAEWNPAFGCVVKNDYHRSELAKEKGVVEIGNDYKSPETIHKEFDEKRADRNERRYQKALDE